MQISQHATSMPPADRAGAGPLKSLSSDLLELLESGQAFSDVTFSVEGRHVSAHRCVLAARSPFFRTIFSGAAPQLQQQNGQPRTSASAAAAGPQVIPVGIVGYDVFKLLLQFLYSGDISFSTKHGARGCKDKTCWHTHCSSAVEFGLETLNAAHFFGVGELSVLTQVSFPFLSFPCPASQPPSSRRSLQRFCDLGITVWNFLSPTCTGFMLFLPETAKPSLIPRDSLENSGILS